MDKTVKYRIFVWLIVILFIIIAPSTVGTPSQIQQKSIVVGIGLDKHEEGLELSTQVLIPEPGGNYSQKQMILQASGKNFSNAVSNLEQQIGKKLGFAHCHIIILSDEILQENLANTLDYLMRSNILGNNTTMVHTNGKAQELLQASSQINNGDINNLETISYFNYIYYISPAISLTTFYNDYLSPSKTSLMSTINVKKQDSGSQGSESGNSQGSSSGSSSSSESSGGSSSGSSSSESSGSSGSSGQQSSQSQSNSTPSQSSSQSGTSSGSSSSESGSSSGASSNSSDTQGSLIDNKGEAIVLKNGIKILSLTKDESRAFDWLEPHSVYGEIQLEEVTNDKLKNASVTFKIKDKQIDIISKMNPKPALYVKIKLDLIIDSIQQENGEILTTSTNYIDDDIQERIKKFVQDDINKALSLCKEHNFDGYKVYKIFNRNNHSEWQDYLKNLDDKENFMQDVEIFVDVVAKNTE